MSSKDMFRKEQRFSFRKFSFGLASAVIANVIFGGAIANTPVVHANTTTETAAVATSERIASIPYTVNIVDQTGKVVETKEKKVLVYTVETIATATEYLTADLVPEGYAIVSGLGEVTLTEKADNIFTVKVDKIAPEAVATTTTAESATSETATAAATPEPASLAATQSTPVTSEVAEAEVAPTTSEESAKPTERTVYLSYITHYVNEANETVDRTGHLVAVKTTDETAKTQVTVSASENMPSGWELVQDKAKVVVQLVENQTNILVFAVTKKSKEEEIAASQLSNKDVLEQVLSEGVLLSNDAARLLETSQAGNTGLEVATNNTKAVLKEAIQVFDEPTSTQEQVDAQTELVRAASKTLADELLKFDEDGVLTAMLDATTQAITITPSSKGAVQPDYPIHIRDFATNKEQREYRNQDFFFGLIDKALTQKDSQIRATAEATDGSNPSISLVGGGQQPLPEGDRYGLNINDSGVIYGTTTIAEPGNTVSWQFKASSNGNGAVSKFTFVPYTVVKTDEEPVRKAVTAGVTADEILAKVKSDVTRGDGSKQGPLNATFEEYFNTELTARATGKSTTVTEDAKNDKQIWHEIVGNIPTTAGTHTVRVRSTNVHGQTIDTQVVVDLYEIVKIPSSASETAPQGYVTVSFNKTPYTKGFTLGTQTGESVKVFVKENVKWGELLDDPAWKWPTVKTAPGDTVVGWGVNVSSADNAYKPENAFSREKYKDIVVTDTKLYPNVVYEVEEVGSRTKDEYLALYGPDERDKWIFIKFDAGQGSMTYKSKQYTSRSVAVYYQNIGYDNNQFTSKVVSPTLDGHTFVRWQTDAGEVLPKSGPITTETTYEALYLAHPTDKTVVFDANKLTETEKDSLKQAISNANPDSANLIQSITVSDTGEAKVTYNDGTVVTVPASHLINEDKEPARNLAKEEIDDKLAEEKAAIEAKRDAAIAEINNTPGLTDDQKQAATDAVTNTANDALTALDTAADDAKKAIDTKTTAADFNDAKTAGEKALDDAKAAGEAAINLTKDKELAKADVDNQAKAAIEAVKNNPNLDATEQAPYIKAIEKAAEEQKAAIDKAKDTAGITDAVNAAEKVNEEQKLAAAKEDAKDKIAEEAAAAKEAIDNNPNLSGAEKTAAKDAVDTEVAKANDAIDKATTPETVQAAEDNGVKAIDAEELVAAKQDAKNKIAEDVKAAKDAIDKDPNLSEDEKKGFKDAVDAEAAKAVADIEKATTPEAAQAAEEAGTAAIAEDVLDAAKQDAKNKIAKDLATVEAAIDANSNLSEDEKKAAKLEAQAKEAEAVANIEKATTPEAVQTLEDAAVKDLANIEIKAAYDDAVKAIEAADNLSTAAKTQALEDLKKARQAAEDAIKTATTADEVAKGALDGLKSIAKVEATAAADDAKAAIAQNSNLTDAEKKVYTDAIDNALKDTETKIDAATDADTVDAETIVGQKAFAKEEVKAATADAVKGIEANTNLTDAKKDEYKATVTTAAEKAEKAITDATTAADIQSKTFDATQDVAKEEVKADAADAIAGIKANDNLSDTAKEEAIAAIEKARNTTLENIENAKTAAAVDTATLDAEKANAKAEIKAAADDAKKAIDENANLPASDKNALKLAIDAEVAATNLEIDNAKTAEEIDAATLATEKSIAKAEVKAAAEDALQAIDENANLTDDEKAKAKADVYVELSKAEKAIDKATTADAIDNATLVGEKAFATAELEAAADDAKKAIDANDNLTPEEKAAAKDAVDAEVAKAEKAIDAATKADEVETATLAGEKAVAKEELKAAAEDAKKAIDANSNLTPEEKQAAKDAVDASAAAANKAIDGSTSSVEVQAAKDKGNAAIAENVLDAAKQGAKNKLMEEADKAKAAIDANPNLTPEEKAAAKAEIDKAVEEAIISINGAGTHHALGEIKLPLSALIKPVVTVTPVLDPNNLTEEEIARIKALLEENNTFPEGTEIIVSKDASVSIKYPDGSIDLILPAEIVKQADTTAPAITDDAKGNIVVAPTKEAVEFVVTYVDNNGKAQLVVVTKGADGKWTTTAKAVIVDPVTGQVIIPGSAIKPGTVVTAYSKDMAGNVSDLNSAEVEAVDANNPAAGVKVKSVTSTSNANKSTKKAKQLPNTGEKATSATSLGLAVLGMGLALFAAKRKKDEEEA